MQYSSYQGTLHRLVPSRYPTINLFEWASSEEEMMLLAEIEGLTNDRIANEIGQVDLVPKHQKRFGNGYSSVMAAFTHIGFGSRFTDGSYGVYYASSTIKTSISEVKFHRQRFYEASNEQPTKATFREYTNGFKQGIKNIVLNNHQHASYLSPATDYTAPNQFAAELRKRNEWGIQYRSVRGKGKCFAVLRPDALTPAKQRRHYEFVWDGSTISAVLDLNIHVDT